jgi:hypothetical protein
MALGLCMGMLCGSRTGLPVSRTGLGFVAAGFAAIAAYAAWDYHRVRQLYLPTAARAQAYQDDTFDKVRSTWLFRDQLAYAQLARIPLHAGTAKDAYTLAGQVLHFSPEPRVIEKRIMAARLLGLDAEAATEAARYRAAFPVAYAAWLRRSGTSSQ